MINSERHLEKKIIRKFLINRRKQLSGDYEKKNMSHVHLRPLLNNINSDYVGTYVDYNFELSTNSLNKYLIERKINICLPKINTQSKEINFFKFSTGTNLIKNKYNILEPEVTNEIIFPKLVLVPLLAFNESGFRLGYGGGFYDKYFSSQEEKDVIKVGLGFSFQKANEIPIESHDQKLDWILTESYLYKAI
ncbi:5-formyltetrahydrofolate cyclo-ligase [Pelagibacteraceae bacterium]|nr:5-formyltetrahydrofolate cyclo-ligase [Pelagibacteraceae bacterium]